MDPEEGMSSKVMEYVSQIRLFFNEKFNHTWFMILSEDLPTGSSILQEVKDFLILTPLEYLDNYKIQVGSDALMMLVSDLKTYLVPNIKEKLMVSNLNPHNRIGDRDRYIRLRLLSEVIPYNVQYLARLAEELDYELHPVDNIDSQNIQTRPDDRSRSFAEKQPELLNAHFSL